MCFRIAASPPGNGGRGLKRCLSGTCVRGCEGIAPRQRGAWIETRYRLRAGVIVVRIAPRQRGAWIETI